MSANPNAPAIARAAGVNPLDYLRERGFVYQVSDEEALREAFAAGPITAYVGFDPSAPSLHVGNLVGIMMLATLQRLGNRVIAVAGGGTALVGDPTGRTSARKPLTPEEIDSNLVGITRQLSHYLDFGGGRFGGNPPAMLVNNAEWLVPLRYIEFLRDVGRHFSVNEMLDTETYRVRLGTSGLNVVEFNYQLVQAYDFLHLYRSEGCVLQMGGSDQWGNIVAGVELIRKAVGGKAFALVAPLIVTGSGEKMGKTAGNAVWLDADLVSPYDYYQYWVNTEDADVARFLRLFTFVPEERIANLTSVTGAALRDAKEVLAFEATALTHGAAAAAAARDAARTLFGQHLDVADIAFVDDPTLPTTEIAAAEIAAGISVADVFVRAGLAASRGDARRVAAQGGLSVNGERVGNVDVPFAPRGAAALLRAGKKRYRRILVV